MAPSFLHSKGTKIVGNQYGLSSAMNEVSYDHTAETADVTVFGDNDRNYIAGQRTGSMSMSGLHDGSTAETDRRLQELAGGSSAAVFTIGVDGDTIGNTAMLISGHVTNYNVSSPAGDVVSANASVQFSSWAHSGKWLADYAVARTSATTHASVQIGTTASTRGGIGHLHVIAGTSNAGTPELSVVIQDSSDNATWADYITFTDVAAVAASIPTHERIRSTATVNEYVRARVDTQNSTNITYAVSFARHT